MATAAVAILRAEVDTSELACKKFANGCRTKPQSSWEIIATLGRHKTLAWAASHGARWDAAAMARASSNALTLRVVLDSCDDASQAIIEASGNVASISKLEMLVFESKDVVTKKAVLTNAIIHAAAVDAPDAAERFNQQLKELEVEFDSKLMAIRLAAMNGNCAVLSWMRRTFKLSACEIEFAVEFAAEYAQLRALEMVLQWPESGAVRLDYAEHVSAGNEKCRERVRLAISQRGEN